MRESKRLNEVKLIKTLKKLKAEDQVNIIRYLNSEAVDALGECFHNILSTNLKLKKQDKRRLKSKLPGNEKILKYIAGKATVQRNDVKSFYKQVIVYFQLAFLRISIEINIMSFQEVFLVLCFQLLSLFWQALL